MSAEFNIDSELLITLVEERPVLWDKTTEEYKDRRLTLETWKDVCRQLKEDFETLPDKERNDIGKFVIKKWTNLRDNWMKCHKKLKDEQKSGSGAKKTRRYMFYEELRFLTKITSQRPTTENIVLADNENEKHEDNKEQKGKPPKSKRDMNELDKKMMCIIDASIEQGQSRIMSFFKGIAPTIDKFNDEDIIDFQLEVMKVIKNITSKFQNSGIPPQPSQVSWNQYNAPRGYQTVGGPSYQTSWANQQFHQPIQVATEYAQLQQTTNPHPTKSFVLMHIIVLHLPYRMFLILLISPKNHKKCVCVCSLCDLSSVA